MQPCRGSLKLEECSENLKPHSTYVLFFPLVFYTEDRISHFHALVVRGSRQRDGGHFRVREKSDNRENHKNP